MTATAFTFTAGGRVPVQVRCAADGCVWNAVHLAESEREGEAFLLKRLGEHLIEAHPDRGLGQALTRVVLQ